MTTILLIRHGESEANRNHVFAGHLDARLVENGVKQAKMTAQYIRETYKVDAVYASDLVRAYETGAAIAEAVGLPIVAEPRLREIRAGKWEGQSFSKLEEEYAADFRVWKENLGRAVCTGGESVAQLGQRIMAVLTEIAAQNSGKTVVVATHATPIRAMECLVKTGDILRISEFPWVSNASVSRFIHENEVWRAEEVSYDVHLAGLRTALPKDV